MYQFCVCRIFPEINLYAYKNMSELALIDDVRHSAE